VSLIAELKRRNVLRVGAGYVVAAWLVIQVVETIFPAFGFGDGAVRLVVIVLAIGLIPVSIAAWALEITPDGLRRDGSSVAGRPISPRTGRQIDAVIMIALALAVGFFAFDRFLASTPIPPVATVTQTADTIAPRPSLAILPFTNMSDDPAQEYLSDGIAEELINLLAGVPELRVISRTSAFAFKHKALTVAELARELNVDYLLEGSVRRSGDRLRITAQLIDARTDSHVWSDTYQRPLDDIFVIQDDIAHSVLPNLQLRLQESLPRMTETIPEAYTLYLQALHFYQQRSAAGVARAIEYVQRSLETDPDYAPSWILLASSYINQAHARNRPFADAFELAGAATDKALEIDPQFALAHSAKAWIAMAFDRDYHLAAEHFRTARRLAPNNTVILTNNSVLAIRLGRLAIARQMIDRSLAADPTSTVAYSNLAEILLRLGRLDDASAAATQALHLSPDNDTARARLALILIAQNRPAEAITESATMTNPAARQVILSMANYDLGRQEAATRALGKLESDHGQSSAYYAAIACAWQGQVDRAFDWLNRAIDEGQAYSGLKSEPFLDPLRDDPRWETILNKAGLADTQIGDIVI
jgi:TolB-like protein/Tfp pilus assembly protein PilF